MIKEMFGWLIAVCRRWALGSNEKNKTSRAKLGVSLIISAYLFGGLLQMVFFFEPEIPDFIPREFVSALLIAIFIVPLVAIHRVFKGDKTEIYIKKYKPLNTKENVKQQFLAFTFCILGWAILFMPFLLKK